MDSSSQSWVRKIVSGERGEERGLAHGLVVLGGEFMEWS